MSEKINVQCYKCKTVYELEYELSGQLVECAVCGAAFEVPQLSKEYQTKTTKTDISVEDENQAPLEGEDPNLKTTMGIESPFVETKTTKLSTKTIRLPKSRCGMLPEVDDKFGAYTARNPLHHQKESDDSGDVLKKSQSKSVEPLKATPWWRFWKKK